MSQKNSGTEKEIHEVFDITLLLKGLNALAELIGGFLLYVVSTENITRIVNFFIRGELIEDPHDIVANYLLNLALTFGGNSKAFAALYLASHGIVNGLVVLGLWKEKIWAYPISFAVIGAFIAYQVYLLTFGYSLWLVILTVLDIIVILLAWHEYRILKKRRSLAVS
jgi:uncharacterized membrane protein